MTITLDLAPDVGAILEARARAQGQPLEEYLRSALEGLASATRPDKQKAAIALLASWRAEDATDDPVELARRDAELEEFKANMNANRAEEGRGPVYP